MGLLTGRVLDYGCGRGYDCDTLDFEGFDPYWRPELSSGRFTTIICNYVANVLPTDEERLELVTHIYCLLEEGGTAYITVRRDIKEDTETQFVVDFDLDIKKETSTYCMYKLTR